MAHNSILDVDYGEIERRIVASLGLPLEFLGISSKRIISMNECRTVHLPEPAIITNYWKVEHPAKPHVVVLGNLIVDHETKVLEFEYMPHDEWLTREEVDAVEEKLLEQPWDRIIGFKAFEEMGVTTINPAVKKLELYTQDILSESQKLNVTWKSLSFEHLGLFGDKKDDER